MPETSHDSPTEEEWLSIGDVARIFGVQVDTIRRWADDGTITHFRPPGPRRHRRFRRADVDQLLATSEHAS